jgi:hypothetical protein
MAEREKVKMIYWCNYTLITGNPEGSLAKLLQSLRPNVICLV